MKPSFARHAVRLIAAASLACTVATVGCTTDRTPGAGSPVKYGPSNAPTMPSSTPGSEQGQPVNPPMTSSYTQPRSFVMPTHVDTDAIAIAAANRAFRGRVLGPADPGQAANPQSANVLTGQFVNPSDTANPQITVNSSISSPPTPVISSGGTGALAGAGVIVSGNIASTQSAAIGSTTSALTSGVTTTPTTAANTISPTVATNTTARASAPAAVITNSGGFLTPTVSSAATMSPNVAANPGIGSVGAGRVVGTTNGVTTATTNGVTTSALTTSAARASGSLVITRSTNGTVTISNVNTGGDRAVSATTTQPATTTPTPGLKLH